MPSRARFPSPLLAVPLLAACGGGNGDAHSTPLANELGDGLRITDIVREATWLDPADDESASCASPPDRSVRVTGVILTAIDRYDETGDGALGNFYVQDMRPEPVEYSGVTVYAPSFSPPDLRLAPGDVADMLGVFTEFLGPSTGRFGGCKTLPELGGTMTFRFEGGHVEPIVVRIEDLKSYETARPYMGMLVRLENASILGTPTNSGGRYSAPLNVGAGVPASDVPKISNELYDVEGMGPPLQNGSSFSAVTGILTYFYGFKIAPRSPEDFEP
ncbi:MAG: hypothetical protein IT372_22115 [Polyangiaceae bacterium]|nr:hypothetical protein [Polyangiaceae bacterium]